MKRLICQMAVVAAVVCAAASVSFAQQTSTSTETKNFEIIAVDGNTLIVKLPEGTRELTVADDFRFIVNGQPLSVRELKAGMKGSATVTTRTTVTPVTVTEVKNGTVLQRSGGTIIVRTADGVKMFSQGELDKRGVKMVKNGKPAEITDFREGDKLSATIVTSQPPHIMTEKEVQATVPTAARAANAAGAPPAAAKAPSSNTGARSTTGSSGSTPAGSAATLPKTASSWPLLAVSSVLLLAIGLVLTIRRRLVE
jgi:LPXTG-motif cell wall-anchored protein